MVEHGRRNALHQQRASDDLAVAAKSRNDDGRLLGLGNFFHRWLRSLGVAGYQQPVNRHQQERADQHGQRHGTDQQ